MEKSFLIIAHKFLPQPDDDLILYLNKQKKENVVHITHSFSDCPDRISRCKWYKNGDLYREWKSKDYIKYPEVLIYIKEFFFTINSVFRIKIKFDFIHINSVGNNYNNFNPILFISDDSS